VRKLVAQQKPEVVRQPIKGRGMTASEFLSVALSFVIGLAVTYLLTSLLSLIRERRTCCPDWLPLLWAFYIFGYQVQYWWASFELSSAPARRDTEERRPAYKEPSDRRHRRRTLLARDGPRGRYCDQEDKSRIGS